MSKFSELIVWHSGLAGLLLLLLWTFLSDRSMLLVVGMELRGECPLCGDLCGSFESIDMGEAGERGERGEGMGLSVLLSSSLMSKETDCCTFLSLSKPLGPLLVDHPTVLLRTKGACCWLCSPLARILSTPEELFVLSGKFP